MPILALNKNGQIYQTSPDREDGLGFGEYPEVVHEGDLTLGASYLKAQHLRQNELLKLKRDQRYLDRLDQNAMLLAKQNAQRASKVSTLEAKLLEDPRIKAQMMKRALMQEARPDYRQKLTGNVLSSNGQHGYNGMTRDQQVIHAFSMNQEIPAHAVEASEHAQAAHLAQAEKLLRLRARR